MFCRLLIVSMLTVFTLNAGDWLYTNDKVDVGCTEEALNEREVTLINHVKNSINLAKDEQSKLTAEILRLSGMSSTKNRCLLNNLLALPNSSYLEIGCWQGSTFISALYGNQEHIVSAIGIDNWSEFGGPRMQFEENCRTYLSSGYQAYSLDCFSIDPTSIIKTPVNIYFYDGAHTAEAQRQAFTHYDSVLDSAFIAIVDDWNHGHARAGTFSAFSSLNYTVLYEAYLPARFNGDREEWWHGLYVAVIRK